MNVISTKPRQIVAALLTVCAAACCVPAQAAPLWYNGDNDNRDAVANQTSNVSPGGVDQIVYENFIVPTGQQWTVNGVFSNNAGNIYFGGYPSLTATWEIRSGVSAGNGGTLVASGDGADTITDTGMQTTVFSPFASEIYTNTVNGLNVVLGPGTYWLAVAPDTDGAADAYWNLVTTSGANAVGTPPGNDGNSFVSSSFFNENFLPTDDPSFEGSGTWDYSLGVLGTAQSTLATPEPSIVAMGLGATASLAAYGLAGLALRRRRNAASCPA